MRRNVASLLLATVVGFAVMIYLYYPGQVFGECTWQYLNGMKGYYIHTAPPMMAFVWGRMAHVIPGAIGMLLLQLAMYWAGVALIVAHTLRGTVARSIAALALGFFPPFVFMMGRVCKDTQMMAALLFTAGLLLDAGARRSRMSLFCAVPALFYANSLRYNAMFAVFPFSIWWGVLFSDLGRRARAYSTIVAAGASLGLFLGIVAASFAVKQALFPGWPPFHQVGLAFDLAGVTLRTGDDVLGQIPGSTRALTIPELGARFTIGDGQNLYAKNPTVPPVFYSDEIEATTYLQRQWWKAVRRHPIAYLQHRTEYVGELLGIGDHGVREARRPDTVDDLLFPLRHNRVTDSVFEALANLETTLVFRPWFFALLGCLALALHIARRSLAGVTIVASGMLTIFSYSVLGFTSSHIYWWWTIASVVFTLFLYAYKTVPPVDLRR